MQFLRSMLSATILALIGVEAAANPPVTPAAVLASIKQNGAKATVGRLRDSEDWRIIQKHIERGEADWIALAPSLAPGTDAASSEDLGIFLAEALPKNPSAVLGALDLRDGPVLGPSRVCGVPFIEPSPTFVHSYTTRAIAAVSGVRDRGLIGARQACLSALRRS